MTCHFLLLILVVLLVLTLSNSYSCSRPNFLSMSSTTLPEKIVGSIMRSPLYGPIVQQARNTMVKTAKSIGLDWEKIAETLRSNNDWEAAIARVQEESKLIAVPEYYPAKFHGYEKGNLCIDAAIEQEIAGKAVGARNFPAEGLQGEAMLRGSYDKQLDSLGAFVPPDGMVLDMGCGTGTSTRRLADRYPHAASVLGIDLSPYMVAVGRHLLTPGTSAAWVENISPDPRVSLRVADMANTGLPDASVSFVSICLVLHELPRDASMQVLTEAWRVLQPGGTLAIMEMDPESPGYRKLRANPWLFSILRSTEPYLDQYFSFAPEIPTFLEKELGFPVVRVGAATGRHLVIVATKGTGGVEDRRPSDSERESSDSHVHTLSTAMK